MNILGISAFYHDSAACLVRDGDIVAAAQEERFSRRKHDQTFPRHAIDFCLRAGAITTDQVDTVVFYEKPWLKFERLLETYLAFAPAGIRSFIKSMPVWLGERLWLDDLLRRELGPAGSVLYPEHHQSHAASAFFPSPFERAAIITLDGVGEWATAAWGTGAGHRVQLAQELRFPHSLGLLYSAFTYYTGFRVNSGEYKVMGLAPYGEPRYVDLILSDLMDLRADGSFRLDLRYFNYCQGLTMTSGRFHDLFGGPPRLPDAPLEQRHLDLARSVQEVAETVMVRMARHVRRQTGERNLCLAGGVALNCVGNGRILRERIFDRLWVQPAAGDAGGALGACLFAWHQVHGAPRSPLARGDSQKGSYLGPAFTSDDIESWLRSAGIPYHRYPHQEIPVRAAALIAQHQVVGWLSGRMEFGPRALGARSILADARSPTMQSLLNRKIKNRESFRPFAPACLAADAAAYFDLDDQSPYMTLVAPVRPERRIPLTPEQERLPGLAKLGVVRGELPAVTHVDYSARIQTVSSEGHSQFRRLLEEFRKLTGCGVVVNTSLNVRGEPIACTPQEACRCFLRTEMDALVLEDCLLLKTEQPTATGETAPEPGVGADGRDQTAEPAGNEVRMHSPPLLRRFGTVMGIALWFWGGVFAWRGRAITGLALFAAGAAMLLTAGLAPHALGPMERTWRRLAGRVQAVVIWAGLTLVFGLAVTPLGLVLRAFGRDPLARRRDRQRGSYWTAVEPDGPGVRPDKPY